MFEFIRLLPMAQAEPVVRLPASPKIRNRQDGTRTRIIDASARLFVAKGFENVSVEEIISATDIARSSFYRFFSNREDVLASIIRPVFEDGIAGLDAIDARAPDGIMAGVFDTYLALWRSGGDALRLSTRTGGIYFELFKDLHAPFRDKIVALIRRVEPSGRLLNGSAELTARLIARTAVPVMEVYHRSPDFETLFHKTMSGFLLAPEAVAT